MQRRAVHERGLLARQRVERGRVFDCAVVYVVRPAALAVMA